MPAEAVRVHGLRELSRAFQRADATLKRELRDGLRDAAEPVRRDAELLARLEIRNIGVPWSRMRPRVTQRAVWVAPVERGVKSRGAQARRRPNLAGLLMDDAMLPALEQNRREVVDRVDEVLGKVGRAWEA